MRGLALGVLGTLILSGCGSESAAPTTQGNGVSLSIPGPDAKKAVKADARGQQPTIPSYSDAVKLLIQRANSAVVSGQHKVAVEALSQAIGLTPEDASLLRMRADVYSLLGEMANARADFSTAVRLAPGNAELFNARGYFLMSQGLPAEAKVDFDKAVELNPKHAAALNNRGLIALTSQDFKSAEADFTKALDADRKFADAWNNRGFARMKQNQLEAAHKDVRQALSLKDDYVTAWNNSGLISMQLQKFEEAEKAFARAVELDPMDARWLTHQRAALIKLNRFQEAQAAASRIEWLNELTSLTQQASRTSRNPDGWILRGRHLMKGDEFGAAVQDFTRAIVVNPGNPVALYDRAVAWSKTGDMQKAMLDCEQSLVSKPSREAYSLRGDLWMNLENLDQAISDFETAGRIDAQVAEAYEKRSLKRRESGETETAKADASRAAEIREALEDKPKSAPQQTASGDGFDPAVTK
jgi:tetratricopeptide (TPR) repeat protein